MQWRPALANRRALAYLLAEKALADSNGSASRPASDANRLAGALAAIVDALYSCLNCIYEVQPNFIIKVFLFLFSIFELIINYYD